MRNYNRCTLTFFSRVETLEERPDTYFLITCFQAQIISISLLCDVPNVVPDKCTTKSQTATEIQKSLDLQDTQFTCKMHNSPLHEEDVLSLLQIFAILTHKPGSLQIKIQ